MVPTDLLGWVGVTSSKEGVLAGSFDDGEWAWVTKSLGGKGFGVGWWWSVVVWYSIFLFFPPKKQKNKNKKIIKKV